MLGHSHSGTTFSLAQLTTETSFRGAGEVRRAGVPLNTFKKRASGPSSRVQLVRLLLQLADAVPQLLLLRGALLALQPEGKRNF